MPTILTPTRCSACGRVKTNAEIEKHNLAAAESGERSYRTVDVPFLTMTRRAA
jgi:hypothetical protein